MVEPFPYHCVAQQISGCQDQDIFASSHSLASQPRLIVHIHKQAHDPNPSAIISKGSVVDHGSSSEGFLSGSEVAGNLWESSGRIVAVFRGFLDCTLLIWDFTAHSMSVPSATTILLMKRKGLKRVSLIIP